VGGAMVDIFAKVFALEGEGPFELEEFPTSGDRAVVRWLHTWHHAWWAGAVAPTLGTSRRSQASSLHRSIWTLPL
jgi:hypothetical protein